MSCFGRTVLVPARRRVCGRSLHPPLGRQLRRAVRFPAERIVSPQDHQVRVQAGLGHDVDNG